MRWKLTAEERFWAKVDKNGPTIRPELGPCWVWTGAIVSSTGYGAFSLNGRPIPAHRAAFFFSGESLTNQALHHCDNRPCVRRTHLYDGTQGDNVRDMVERGRQSFGARSNVCKGDTHYLTIDPARSARAKFSPDQVRQIRATYAAGGVRYADIAAGLGVHEDTVAGIVRRDTYRHVT